MILTRRIALCAALLTVTLAAPAQAAFPGQDGRLVYQKGDDVAVGYVEPEEGLEVVVANDALDPNWAPDGSRIVLSLRATSLADDQIAVVRPDGTGLKPITTTSKLKISRASWSPDATKIIFDRYNTSGNRERIMVMNANGSGLAPLTSPAADDVYDYSPAWSPDGRLIAFVADTPGALDIHLMKPDGSHRRVFVATTASESDPAWSPDSTRIAYERDNDVVVKPLAGGPVVTIAESANQPEWSPDGEWIIYSASRILTAGPATTGVYKRLANGTGDEFLISPAGTDNGSWQPRCDIRGNGKANTLTGTSKAELICGKGGKDTIDGKGGDDVIFGGPGADTVGGGRGDDLLVGESGDDKLNGGSGTDRCVQGPGAGPRTSCES